MLKVNIPKTLALCFGVLALILSLSYLALAWTEPQVTAPGNNVSAPINVGSITQAKIGGLQIDGVFYTRGIFDAEGGSGNSVLTVIGNKVDVDGSIRATGDICTDLNGGKCLSNQGGSGGGGTNYWTLDGDSLYNNVGINIGIGGSKFPKSPLSFGDNVAVGFLDKFSEYQILLYNSDTAANSYGIGKKMDYVVFNSEGGYSFDKKANTTSMIIDTNGNVGIGTVNPAQKLDINGQARAIDFCTTAGKCLSTVGGGGGGTNYWTLSGSSLFPSDSGYNIGIGLTNPGRILDVSNRIRLRSGSAGTAGIWLANSSGIEESFMGKFSDGAGDKLGFWNGGAWQLIVQDDGNVGIGNTAPSQKLDVSGKIVMRNETVSSDPSNTVVTKGYLDSKIGGLIIYRMNKHCFASWNSGPVPQNDLSMSPTCIASQCLSVSGSHYFSRCDSDACLYSTPPDLVCNNTPVGRLTGL
ncbi:MAG: hypothetical protein E4H47_01455 [Parcubacteria group bacterium]|nr:MAG: hypothetical protein E4H47_01455 [Parcubacteria group bacterium]